MVIVGFGCIGQGVLPLLQRHLVDEPARITLLSPESPALARAAGRGLDARALGLHRHDFQAVLEPLLRPGDLLLNLSVGVDSVPLIALARRKGVLYVDTALEPWADEPLHPPARRSNHARREAALALGRDPGGPTAVITHGANPGLVSHFVKAALLHLAAAQGAATGPGSAVAGRRPQSSAAAAVAAGAEPPSAPRPATREGWALLARDLGVRAIHIAERDTQWSMVRRAPGEFVNTWSVPGFVEEALQPAELGWGTHERAWPADARRHARGSPASIWLDRPGAAVRVRSWTPLGGPLLGHLITHAEAISIADHLTMGDPQAPEYRPTVHYAYRPCDDALLSLHEMQARGWAPAVGQRLLADDLVDGTDELGVLLGGPAGGALWLGSQLTLAQARAACSGNSATSLQVAAGVMAAAVWAVRHPQRGLLEPDDLPHEEILALARPYLGTLAVERTAWNPLQGRDLGFGRTPAPGDDDPWQFAHVRVD
jgi:homospermidine synthase